MPALTAADDGPHLPPHGRDPSWQESWSLDWYDPAARAAAAYRIRVNWGASTAEVRTWALIDGQVTSRAQTSRLPDDRDVGACGPATCACAPSSRSARASSGPGRIREVTYTAATKAIRFSMSGQRADPGAEYYESFGTVTGTVSGGGRAVQVSAHGFYRHSWGVPNGGTQPVQSVHGMFGDDLFFSIVEYRTPAGNAPLGYLFEDGEFHGVEKARFRTDIDSGRAPRMRPADSDRRPARLPDPRRRDLGRPRRTRVRHLRPRPAPGTGILELHDQR